MRGKAPVVLTALIVASLAAAAVWLVVRDVPSPPLPASPGAARPARAAPPGAAPAAFDTSDAVDAVNELPPLPDDLPQWRGDESIDRRVVGEDGVTPVAGVTVTLLVMPPPTPENRRPEPVAVARTVTRADGTFRFDGLARRGFQVRVEARHRRATTWTAYAGGRPERRSADSGLAPGDMQIGRDLLVHFVVVDEHDQAVPGAEAELLGPDGKPVGHLTCDDRGRLDWRPWEDGLRVIVFRAPGRATEVLQGWRQGGETRVVMRPGHVIAGVVVDAAGRPVREARVTISQAAPLGDPHVFTDGDGEFRFEALHVHPTIRVTVRKGGGAPTVVSTPTGREDVRIVMPPDISGGVVRGVVLRPDGTPAAGAVVDLSATCDAGGRFELRCNREGDIVVGARYGTVELPVPPHRWHAEFGRAELRLPPGGDVGNVTILLQPAPVSFAPLRLTDGDGIPLSGVAVGAASGGFGGVTDTDGRAVVAFLDTPAGTMTTVGIGSVVGHAAPQRVEVVTRAAWDGPPEQVVLEDAPRITVEVAGVPKDAWDAIEVRAVPRERSHGAVATRVGTGTEFAIGVLDQGAHLVMVGCPGGGALGVVPAGGRERRLHLDVRRGAALRVTIADPDGETPRDIRRVTVLWERAAPWGAVEVGRLQRGDDGEWTGERLPAGRLLLAVDRGFVPSAMRHVEVRETGTNTAHVALPRRVSVSGEVRGATSAPLGGCLVSLRLPGGPRPSDRFGPLATTGADGRFELTLDPIDGAYLAFEREGHATRMVPIDGSLARRVHRVNLEPEGTVVVRSGHVAAARLPGSDAFWEPYVEPSTISPPPGGTPLRRLPAGDVELLAMADDGTATVHPVRVVPGRTVELELGPR